MEYSFKKLPFLDILIKNESGQIITNIYHKCANTQQYHPQYYIKSIPYTLACIICTIATNKKPHSMILHQKGYLITLINKGFKLAEKISLKELQTQKT